MRESDLLAHIYARSAGLGRQFPQVLAGPGDDCAILAPPSGPILATVDHLIEGRHFESPAGSATSFDSIARKAVARSLSDIAAMGGSVDQWGAALATAALPHAFPQHDADALFDRLQHWTARFGCPLVGGDAATFGQGAHAGPLTLTVTVLGLAHERRGPVRRTGAQPGDAVYVTGALGGSLASGRHLTFTPRLAEAAALCDSIGTGLHAMLDISDGLGRDAARIATASGVTIELDAGAIPRHDGCDWRSAVRDGEDYELLFAAGPGAAVPSAVAGTPVTRVGAVLGAPDDHRRGRCLVRAHGAEPVDVSEEGWDHR